MDIKNFEQNLFEKAKEMGFADYEMYIQSGNSFSVKINKGEVEQYSNSYIKGVGFRGIYNEKMGYSFSEKVDVSIIDELLVNARDNSELIETEDKEIIFEGSEKYDEVISYSDKLNETTVEQKIEMAKEIEKYAFAEDKRVKNVNYCVVSNGEEEIFISNSKGLQLTKKSNFAVAYTYVTVEEGSDIKLYYDYWMGDDFNKIDTKKIAKTAVQGAIKQLGASKVKSGQYNIILKNEIATDFLSVFKGVFYAYTVQKGFSKLKDKLNEKISSSIITLIDTGNYEGSMSNCSFDSEGVAKSETVLIEKGILKNYLYNLKTAQKDGVQSTGNGFKSSFKSTIGTSITNFYVQNGTESFEDLVKNMNEGIVVTDLAGLHSGADTISGDFSLIASGFLVENGEIVKPVEQFTIAGNFYDLIQNIEGVSNDLKFGLSISENVGCPSINVGKLMVAGE